MAKDMRACFLDTAELLKRMRILERTSKANTTHLDLLAKGPLDTKNKANATNTSIKKMNGCNGLLCSMNAKQESQTKHMHVMKTHINDVEKRIMKLEAEQENNIQCILGLSKANNEMKRVNENFEFRLQYMEMDRQGLQEQLSAMHIRMQTLEQTRDPGYAGPSACMSACMDRPYLMQTTPSNTPDHSNISSYMHGHRKRKRVDFVDEHMKEEFALSMLDMA